MKSQLKKTVVLLLATSYAAVSFSAGATLRSGVFVPPAQAHGTFFVSGLDFWHHALPVEKVQDIGAGIFTLASRLVFIKAADVLRVAALNYQSACLPYIRHIREVPMKMTSPGIVFPFHNFW